MTKADLIRRLRSKFIIALQTKERWTPNQIIKLYDSLVRDILFEDLEEKEQKELQKSKERLQGEK